MTEISILQQKASAIEKYLSLLSDLKKLDQKEIENNPIARGALERYLYLLCQATLDFGEAAISLKELRKPATYSEIFSILEENNLISANLTQKMVKMAGFRNIIAHDYENIDFNIIYGVLENNLPDIKEFLTAIRQKLNF